MRLVIGNRNYSSWSLRAWLALRFMDLDPEIVRIPLDTPEFGAQIREYSNAACVPVLLDGDLTIWDSLAICEYAAERSGSGWPLDEALRARARAAVCEMHSGFAALRSELPMNIRARRRVDWSAAAERDIERITQLWCEALSAHDGTEPGLFGTPGIPDAFFAPVVFRFRSYGVPTPELCAPWIEWLLSEPRLAPWIDEAEREREVLEIEERGVPLDA